MEESIRVAIIGTGNRSFDFLWACRPAASGCAAGLCLGTQPRLGARLGESLGVPWYTDLDKLIRETAPQIGIVSVTMARTARSV